MTSSIPEKPGGVFFSKYCKTKKIRTAVIGPGMGRDGYSREIFFSFINSLHDSTVESVLIDGDGLFHLAEYLEKKALPGNINFVITPHLMEAAGILKISVQEIGRNRYRACSELAETSGAVTVLKGPGSVISDGNRSYINTRGNESLATAGSGDVLSGIIASFLNRDMPPAEACAAGVYIHGMCSELSGEDGALTVSKAGDIIRNIKKVISELQK